MPERRLISSGSPWETRFGYSRAVRAGRQVFVAGTTGRNSDGSAPAGALEQSRRALEIIVAALREAGASPRHVVRTRVFVTDMAHFEAVATAHAEVFGEIRPASTLVAVSQLVAPELLVEIEADAVVDDA